MNRKAFITLKTLAIVDNQKIRLDFIDQIKRFLIKRMVSLIGKGFLK